MQIIQFTGLAALIIGASFVVFTPNERFIGGGDAPVVIVSAFSTAIGLVLFTAPVVSQMFSF